MHDTARGPSAAYLARCTFLAVLALIATGCAASNAPPALGVLEPIAALAPELVWQAGPPALPGSRVAVLEGDPKQAQIFTMRVELPKGAKLGPHTHPNDERVTVLSGVVFVGFGEVFDVKQARRFQAGDYYVNPSGAVHYVWSEEGAVLQMTAIGPWGLEMRGK
jgi:quercetin dioxygenase-like cupin family protein